MAAAAAAPAPAHAVARATISVERVGRGTRETIGSTLLDGRPSVGANTLARLVGGTKYWRPDLRKLEIRTVRHSLRLTVDDPYVLVDDVALRLPAPVRLVRGEVRVPIDIFPLALSGRFLPRAAYDERSGRLVLFDQEPNLGPPALSGASPGARTRLVLPLETALEPSVLSSRRSRFLVEISGAVLAAVPGDSLPGQGLLSAVKFKREPGGVLLDLALSPAARSYRVQAPRGQSRLDVEFSGEVPDGFVAFAPEYGAPPNRPLRVLVIDPGHGGADSGYVAGGLREKDLTLRLARLVRDRLKQRLPGLEIRLTRDADRALGTLARVEAANRAHGDLYLSLHFDGVPGTAARGVSAIVSPPLGFDVESAFAAVSDEGRRAGVRPLALVSWRDAAGRYASDSRGVAELLLAALDADGHAPVRLRQARMLPLEGANMPAVMLECGTLSSPAERRRLAGPKALARLADVLARALERYAGGGFWE